MKFNTLLDSNWTIDHIMDQPDGNTVLQEHITYRKVNGRMERTTITRRYYGVNDYQDSVACEILE